MGVRYLAISAACTVVSMIGLQCWTEISLEKFKADGLIGSDTLYSENASHIIELLLRSHATITLLAICLINAFVLFILSIKTIFFGELYAPETRKLVERLVNYVIYKGTFLPLIIPPTIIQATLWMTWLTVLCFLKMFQALARDRLERLNASPSATLWTYFRVYSALLLVLAFDCLWIWFCAAVSGPLVSSTYWLLFFEPLSIAFETLQAIVVHGFQLMDIWLHHSAAETSDSQRSKFFDTTAGSLWEWKSNVVRNMGFFLDMMTLLMALGHYVLIWWLHGMTIHLVDAILFLNIRALLSAVVKRIKGFVKLKIALGALHEALPDATTKEIQSYDDECAICREPMAKAKRLPCNHLFHLACLRSWLDQGLNEVYSCPTCRKPLFVGRSESEASSHTRVVSSDEQLARQLSSGVDPVNAGGVGVFPNQNQISPEVNPWRGAGADSSWLQPWPSQGLDGAGPSTAIRSAGLGRVQMMMRHLASVGENYAQTALEDTSWSLWPTNSSQATTSSTAFPPAAHRYPATSVSAHRRTASRPANDSIANLLAMAETVREVLPHIPDEMIFQGLPKLKALGDDLHLLEDYKNMQLCLSQLIIWGCPELTSIPLCLKVDDLWLYRFNKRLKILQTKRDEKIGEVPPSLFGPENSSKSSSIPTLKHVGIDNVMWLKSLPMVAFQSLESLDFSDVGGELESFEEFEDVFCNCSSSLRILQFDSCERLRSVCGGLEHLTALKELSIGGNCPNVRLSEETEDCRPWRSLHHSLRKLKFKSLPQLVSLPDWMQSLSALEILEIRDCKRLKSIPDWMPKLTSLNRLQFINCSKSLKSRCQKDPPGEDWSYIKHIPSINSYDL